MLFLWYNYIMTREITNATEGPDGPWYFLYFDGSCYPNPGGEMGLGWALYEGRGSVSLGSRGEYPASPPTLDLSNRGELIAFGAESAGPGTNNRAEYLALIAGLRRALFLGVRRLVVVGDSQLTVRQVDGHWECRDEELRAHRRVVWRLRSGLKKMSMRFVKRADNGYCDSLAAEKPAIPQKFTAERYLVAPITGRLLTDRQAALMQWLWAARGFTSGELGRIFGMNASHAWNIATRARYKDIGEEHL